MLGGGVSRSRRWVRLGEPSSSAMLDSLDPPPALAIKRYPARSGLRDGLAPLPRVVRRAQEVLREAGREDEAARLDGVSWHGLRHTWASRLTMAGVDPRTLQTLGNWRSLSMVERYRHLSPDHLRSAVEELASPSTTSGAPVAGEGSAPGLELDSNLTRPQDEPLRAP